MTDSQWSELRYMIEKVLGGSVQRMDAEFTGGTAKVYSMTKEPTGNVRVDLRFVVQPLVESER